MSILICVFALLNGIFSMIRVNMNFLNLYEEGEGYNLYQTIYCLESICFCGAVWFYSIIYFQTARDIKRLINFTTITSNEKLQGRLHTRRRKTKRLIFNWLMFALLVIC